MKETFISESYQCHGFGVAPAFLETQKRWAVPLSKMCVQKKGVLPAPYNFYWHITVLH